MYLWHSWLLVIPSAKNWFIAIHRRLFNVTDVCGCSYCCCYCVSRTVLLCIRVQILLCLRKTPQSIIVFYDPPIEITFQNPKVFTKSYAIPSCTRYDRSPKTTYTDATNVAKHLPQCFFTKYTGIAEKLVRFILLK